MSWLLLLACHRQDPPMMQPKPLDPAPVTSPAEQSLTLVRGEPQALLGGQVILEQATASSTFVHDWEEVTTPAFGTLRFERDGKVETVDFEQDATLHVWGRQMVVRGPQGDQLVVLSD
ncbi:MAG: hypothetical protein VX899_26455 [Myxococcota bacterium]|nr:hypothetical protein [Myxococcota bacterium]